MLKKRVMALMCYLWVPQDASVMGQWYGRAQYNCTDSITKLALSPNWLYAHWLYVTPHIEVQNCLKKSKSHITQPWKLDTIHWIKDLKLASYQISDLNFHQLFCRVPCILRALYFKGFWRVHHRRVFEGFHKMVCWRVSTKWVLRHILVWSVKDSS